MSNKDGGAWGRWPYPEGLAFWCQGSGGGPQPGMVPIFPGLPVLPFPQPEAPRELALQTLASDLQLPAEMPAQAGEVQTTLGPERLCRDSCSMAGPHGDSILPAFTPNFLSGQHRRGLQLYLLPGPNQASDPAPVPRQRPSPWRADASEVRRALRGHSCFHRQHIQRMKGGRGQGQWARPPSSVAKSHQPSIPVLCTGSVSFLWLALPSS